MSCAGNLFPVFLDYEKDDAPSNYLGFRDNCKGKVGAFEGYNYISNYSDGGQSTINNSQSSISQTIQAQGSRKIDAEVDNYGNITTTLSYRVYGVGGGQNSASKLFCCPGASECQDGTEQGSFNEDGTYTVVASSWDPCYTWPNGYRGTWSTYLAISKSNRTTTWTDPCGGGGESSNESCTRDLSKYPDIQNPENCGLIGGDIPMDCRIRDLNESYGPGGAMISSYVRWNENTFVSSEVTPDSFYSRWMKKSAKKIINDIKENNDKKNCCPGSGYPRPCNNFTDWYNYPYSRPVYNAPEGSEFTEEFLNGNCWKGGLEYENFNIEIKNPKVNEFLRKIQAFKFSAAIDVTNLNDYELSQVDSRAGEVIVYTPDPNYNLNDAEAPTPCCNSCGCFAGKILNTYEFKFSEESTIKKNQWCGQSNICSPVETRKYAVIDSSDPLYNDDLYNNYYSQLEQQWDETSPSFIVRVCIKTF